MSNENSVNYWQIIEPIWKDEELYSDEPKVFLKRFSELTEPQKILFPTHWFYSEVGTDGFHGFFNLYTGMFAPEAVLGFKTFGLNDIVDVIEEAMSFFGNPYPRETETREELLDLFEEENDGIWDPFVKLEDKYYELLKLDGISLSKNDHFGVAVGNYAKNFLK